MSAEGKHRSATERAVAPGHFFDIRQLTFASPELREVFDDE